MTIAAADTIDSALWDAVPTGSGIHHRTTAGGRFSARPRR